MKKDFLTITPDSGGGSAEVQVTADLNPNFKSRETTLNLTAAGGISSPAVKVIQQGIVLQSNVSFLIMDTARMTSIASKTINYSLSGDYPIQIVDLEYQGKIETIFCQLQLLVRKDYLDIPGNDLMVNEVHLGVTDFFTLKIPINSEYNLYLYEGQALQITSDVPTLEMVIGPDSKNFIFGCKIQKS